MKRRGFIIALVFVFLIATVALVGCGGNGNTGGNGGGEGNTSGVGTAGLRWRYQSIWVPSITLWRGDKYFSDLVNVLAEGDLAIEYYEGGSLVTTSGELFDAVAQGTLDMGSDWPSYWEGKDTAFGLVTSTPMIFTPADYMVWMWQGGGLELVQELYAEYNLVWFPHSIKTPEAGMRSNVPIKTVDDYAGLKMRQCGRVQAMILEDLGGAAIFMPGAELYLALQRGTIDAAEFSVPEVDWSMGFQEVTKYWVVPGWHQPGPLAGIMINQDSWNELPDRVKFIFKEAAMSTMMWAWTYFEYSSIEYTEKFLDAGTEMSRLDDAALDRIQDLAWGYLINDAKDNPNHAKIAFSQILFLKGFSQHRDNQAPFMFGRNPKGLDAAYTQLEQIAKDHGVYDEVIQLERDVRVRMERLEFWEQGTPYTSNPR
jgi:TRAP-type mannitol/chloroaromatic compound transport system substrate-binding protein